MVLGGGLRLVLYPARGLGTPGEDLQEGDQRPEKPSRSLEGPPQGGAGGLLIEP